MKKKHGKKLNDEIKINKFKKKKSKPTLTFKTSDSGHELITNPIEDEP
jgi:hypothetical protein